PGDSRAATAGGAGRGTGRCGPVDPVRVGRGDGTAGSDLCLSGWASRAACGPGKQSFRFLSIVPVLAGVCRAEGGRRGWWRAPVLRRAGGRDTGLAGGGTRWRGGVRPRRRGRGADGRVRGVHGAIGRGGGIRDVRRVLGGGVRAGVWWRGAR